MTEPTVGTQYAVHNPDGAWTAYGDQSWVSSGRCVTDGSWPDGVIRRRTVTITYGPWEDHTPGDPTQPMPEPHSDYAPPEPGMVDSPAVLLREAAIELREYAATTTPGPWCRVRSAAVVRSGLRNVEYEDDCGHGECATLGMYDGHYAALMHPPVALALADLLESLAPLWTGLVGEPGDYEHEALLVARAVLRRREGATHV